MTDTKRPLKVFLCHAHADRDPVRGLYTRLTQDGVDAWLDKAKLLPGQDWELEIRKAALCARVFDFMGKQVYTSIGGVILCLLFDIYLDVIEPFSANLSRSP